MTPPIGVISLLNSNLIWQDNGRLNARRFGDNMPELTAVDAMAAVGIRQAWIEPGGPSASELAWPNGSRISALDTWWFKVATPAGEFRIADAGNSRAVGAWHCWSDASSGSELARELAKFSECIGILPVAGPGSTGDILIRKTRPDDIEHSRALDRPKDYAQADLVWIRPERPQSKYLHAFDCSAQYLSVLGGLRLGIGARWELRPAEIERALAAPSDLPAGYWRVTRYEREPEPEWWPEPVSKPRRHDAVWLTTPMLELLLLDSPSEAGAVAVDQAIVCSGSSRVLEPFYKRLKRAREAGVLCEAAVKEVYTRTIGRFASTQWDRAGDPLYRPDWRDSIVAQARANLHRMIAHVANSRGLLPAAVYVDELFYPSDSIEPDWALGRLPADRFKFSGTLEVASSRAWREPTASGRRRKPDIAELVRELRP